MKKEAFNTLKTESVYLISILVLLMIIFKLVFYKENLANIIRFALSFYIVFLLPGFSLMLYWKGELAFFERFIIAVPLSAALIGALSYYIGIIGIHIKYLTFILPILLIFLGVGIYFRVLTVNKEKSDNSQQ